MEIPRILVSAFIGTSVMTVFSYMISESFGKMYREPTLLAVLFTKFGMSLGKRAKLATGWILHYAIGVVFVMLYEIVWNTHGVSVLNSALFGIASGILGILAWNIAFRLAPASPNLDYRGYFIQLFFAHLLFTASAAFAWMGFTCIWP